MRLRSPGLGGDPRWLEAASGIAAIGWSLIVLAVPAELLTLPAYYPLLAVAPVRCFAIVTLLAGVAQLVGVLTDHQRARILFAAALAGIWLLLAFVSAAARPVSPTLPLLLAYAAGNALAMVALIRLHHRVRI